MQSSTASPWFESAPGRSHAFLIQCVAMYKKKSKKSILEIAGNMMSSQRMSDVVRDQRGTNMAIPRFIVK